MKNQQRPAVELEAELLRLNALVRERRKELARLEKCPNKTCTCRLFWRDHVEKTLARQMGKIRRQLRTQPGKPGKAARAKQPTAKAAKK